MANGIFAMSEIALVSSKKSRLEDIEKKGNKKAAIALKLLEKPEDFLSAIQLGITLIGVLSGAFGGVAIADDLSTYLKNHNLFVKYAYEIAFFVVVIVITYFSIVIGELVPKVLAFSNPEKTALIFAPLIKAMMVVSRPIVAFLSISTSFFSRLLFIKKVTHPPVTEEELKILIEQGREYGIFEIQESEMMKSILRFTDRKVYSVMINRQDVEWIDINDKDQIKEKILGSKFSVLPVCEDSLDKIIGIIYVKDYYNMLINSHDENIHKIIKQPLFIPDNLTVIKLLERFKSERIYIAIVVDEYGTTEGLITLHDLMENIFGDIPEQYEIQEKSIIRREDGSLLVDGSVLVDELKDVLELSFENDEYSTLGGFMMFHLKKVPDAGDYFIFRAHKFEVMDMDDKRVDKVLIQLPGTYKLPAEE